MILAMSNRDDERDAELLRTAARDPDDNIRTHALRGLTALGDEEGSDIVRRLAKGSVAKDRVKATELAASAVSDDSNALLGMLARDGEMEVAGPAILALHGRSPNEALDLARAAYARASAEARVALLGETMSAGEGLSIPLSKLALRDGDDAVVAQAIGALSSVATNETAQLLLDTATNASRSADVRNSAAAALREMGGPLARANAAVLEALADTADVPPGASGGPEE